MKPALQQIRLLEKVAEIYRIAQYAEHSSEHPIYAQGDNRERPVLVSGVHPATLPAPRCAQSKENVSSESKNTRQIWF